MFDIPFLAAQVRHRSGNAPSSGKGLLAALGAALMSLVLTMAATAQQSGLPAPDGEVLLMITGNITATNDGDRAQFDRAMLEELPQAVLKTRTVVTDGIKTFEGVLMRDLLGRVGAEGEAVTASALNDYIIDIPMSDFRRFDVLVATHMDGKQLEPFDKGPLWIVYPRDAHGTLQDIRYDYRWVWQLTRIEVR